MNTYIINIYDTNGIVNYVIIKADSMDEARRKARRYYGYDQIKEDDNKGVYKYNDVLYNNEIKFSADGVSQFFQYMR